MKFIINIFIITILNTIIFSKEVKAQHVQIIKGNIINNIDKNIIYDVKIFIEGENYKNEILCLNGKFIITLAPGNYNLKFTKIGYSEKSLKINLFTDINQDVYLENDNILSDVTVYTKNSKVKNTSAGIEKINIKDLEKMPNFFGEQDILKSIVLQPGVISTGDGSSSYYVRGGSVDQNLILYDEATIYNPNHILGFYSTFNNDIIKEATLYKGNMPAQYGGRLSSILDIKTREGDNKKVKISGGIGNITSKINFEGPLKKGFSSYLFSVRKTHINYLLQLSDQYKNNRINIYDLNFKINNIIDSNNKIIISGYLGNDNIEIGTDLGINWSNRFMTIQWEKRIKLNFKSTSTLYTSNYTYNNLFKTTSSNWILNSSIKDYGIKQNLEYIKNKNRINFGYNSIYYITEPKTYLQNLNNGFNNNGKKGIENILYFNNDTKLNKKILLEYGFRFNLYTFLNDELLYDFENNITQVKTIESNNKNKNFFNIEPRISSRFDMGKNKYLKFAVSRNVQHLHLLNNANIYEQWIANSDKVLPEIADQVSLGLEKWSKNNFYELNVDIYYKNLQNQIDFKESIGFNSIVNYENTIAYGIGRSYGLELKILKHDDIFSGWISYGLSKSEKLIAGINNNDWYNNIQDRRHSISFLTMYKINRKINISSVFIYYSGSAITYPIGRYTLFDQNVFLYGQRNVNRTPSYHRLDLSFNYDNLSKKKIKSKWNFTIYNVYGRENPYRINFKQNPLNKNETMIVQTALFKWVPSINYSFNF
jgi:hypothetical protein